MCIGKISNNTGFRQLMLCCVSEFQLPITILWMQNKTKVLSIYLCQLFTLPSWRWHTLFNSMCPVREKHAQLAKLWICSLNLTVSSAFHPIHSLPSKRVVPSPVLGKLFLPGSEAPLALSLVWTACPDPGVRMTWRKVVLQMGVHVCV